ncbi:glycosyl transferase [Aurantimonas sp. Leaf443]|nr:glycosyl transferase [Aurantimonas sp. Leaf443]
MPDGGDRFDVLGVKVGAIDLQGAVERIERAIDTRTPIYVCITGVHGVVECQGDEALLRIHNEAGLVTPDGMPLVWIARLRGLKGVSRVYGPDLMRALTARAPARGDVHFYYGGGEGLAARLKARLTGETPGLNVCGTLTPPFRALTEAEDRAVVEAINRARPDILFVGLSTPKQERWMHAHRSLLDVPVMIGVGAAFDFLAGEKKQAPRWMQASGLEWLFRACSEPRRLGRRYLRIIPVFGLGLVSSIVREVIRRR